MARPSYSLNIPGIWTRTEPDGDLTGSGTVNDLHHSEESSSGVTRHKPTGWISPTAYSVRYFSYRRAQGSAKNRYRDSANLGQFYYGCVGGSRFNSLNHFNGCVGKFWSDLNDDSLMPRAELNARLKLKRADVNLGVAFAERNRTAKLLGDTAISMAKAFNNLKRGRVRAAMRDLGIANSHREPRGSSVPKKWLELQYGWKPAISDVYGACVALSRRDKSDWRVTSRGRLESETEYVKTYYGAEASICRAQVWSGAFVRIDALPENDLMMSLASLGITNPALIAWELAPASFVVDWILPIGDWLESIDALNGYSRISTSRSAFVRADWVDTGYSYLNPENGFTVTNDFVGSQRVIELRRTVSNGVSFPTFPRFKDPRSLGHMANGLALLSQAFSRR